MYILEETSGTKLNKCQFGFVKHCGTSTAISLAKDISEYCKARGSNTFLCSLDAEGAFDAIPHSILYHKAAKAIPDPLWRVLFTWYQDMTVCIRWNHDLSTQIPVRCGTRQGGLSSPFLFNLFYKDLLDRLHDEKCGVIINRESFSCYCYADDLLLCSTICTNRPTETNKYW